MKSLCWVLALATLALVAVASARILYVSPTEELYDIALALLVAESGDEIVVDESLNTALLTFATEFSATDIVIRGVSYEAPAPIGAVVVAARTQNITFQWIKFDSSLLDSAVAFTIGPSVRGGLISGLHIRECQFGPGGSTSGHITLGVVNSSLSIVDSLCNSRSPLLVGQPAYVSTIIEIARNQLSGCAVEASGTVTDFLYANNSFSCTDSCYWPRFSFGLSQTRVHGNSWTTRSSLSLNFRTETLELLRNTIETTTGIAMDVKDAVISYNVFPDTSRTDPYFFYFGSQARVDLRLNYWGSTSAPTFPLANYPRNLVFPWCLTPDCSILSQDCSQTCGISNCDSQTGKCSVRIGAVLLPALLVPITIIMACCACICRSKIADRNERIYRSLSQQAGNRQAIGLLDGSNQAAAPVVPSIQSPEIPHHDDDFVIEKIEDGDSGIEVSTESVCVICMSEPRRYAMIPCGHLALCRDCALQLEKDKRCPLCRQAVLHVQHVYL